jgi:hypothetical protein
MELVRILVTSNIKPFLTFGRCAICDSARMLPAGLDHQVKLPESPGLRVNKFKGSEVEAVSVCCPLLPQNTLEDRREIMINLLPIYLVSALRPSA